MDKEVHKITNGGFNQALIPSADSLQKKRL